MMNIDLAPKGEEYHLRVRTRKVLFILMCEHRLGSAVGKAHVLQKTTPLWNNLDGNPLNLTLKRVIRPRETSKTTKSPKWLVR